MALKSNDINCSSAFLKIPDDVIITILFCFIQTSPAKDTEIVNKNLTTPVVVPDPFKPIGHNLIVKNILEITSRRRLIQNNPIDKPSFGELGYFVSFLVGVLRNATGIFWWFCNEKG